MRTWLRLVGLAALALVAAAGAGAEQYNVTANAGNDGDSHLNNDDPDAEAEFVRSDVGTEVYRASANAAFGSLSASASRQDPLPPGVTTSSGASIEETIHFSELPAGSVTIRATLGVAAQATSATGVARASASLTLRGSTGDCTYSMTQNSVLGFQDSNGCAATGGSAGDGVVELTLTSDQLLASNAQVDIEANVSAQLENLGAGISRAVRRW
jgi:hypothetical protein